MVSCGAFKAQDHLPLFYMGPSTPFFNDTRDSTHLLLEVRAIEFDTNILVLFQTKQMVGFELHAPTQYQNMCS